MGFSIELKLSDQIQDLETTELHFKQLIFY